MKAGASRSRPLWMRALQDRDVEWSTTDLNTIIHWQRQVLGVVTGLVWGSIPLTGFYAFLGGVAVNVIIVYIYYTQYLGVDDEDHGGHPKLIQEGLAPAIALFLLCWITLYSMTQFP